MSTPIAPAAAHGTTTALGARERRLAAFFAAALGLLILAGAGFAPVEAVHNAAHDARHSIAFPCH